MNNTPMFIMPFKLNGSELELRHFRTAVNSIKNQTDENWELILIDSFAEEYFSLIGEQLRSMQTLLFQIT